MRVGRDHVSATVNTLVLAYMGAALPLFLVIVMADSPLSKSLTNEVIAAEIVRSLVGGLGIIAAIPITTVLAAWVLTRGSTTPTRPTCGPGLIRPHGSDESHPAMLHSRHS